MQTNIYTYLQRYLLKIRVKSCYCTGHKKSLIKRNLNTYFENSKYLPLVSLKGPDPSWAESPCPLNLNTTKKFFLTSYCDVNKMVLKRSKKQYSFSSSFWFFYLKNDRLLVLIKTVVYFNETNLRELPLNDNSFQPHFFFKIKKNSVFIVENMAFDFYNKKALASYNFKNSHDFFYFVKIEKTFLKSFYNLAIYSHQKFILNKKREREWISSLFITFPETLTLVKSRVNNYEPLLLHNMLIFIDNFFFNGLKYVKQKKLIKNTEYKVFKNLITKVYFYQFHKKNPNKVVFKLVHKKIYMINGLNFYYYLMRPLFALTRLDTFYICESLKLPVYPDQSNYKVDFLRNRVRKQILPAIRILLNPQFDTILCKFNESYV